jgi:hypothetical protein
MSKLPKEQELIEARRAYFFADINIVRVSALALKEFNELDVELLVPSLPFHELPSGDRLSEIHALFSIQLLIPFSEAAQ